VTTCARCGRALGDHPAFRLEDSAGALKCFRCAVSHGPMLRRSLVIGLAVGSVLTAINQGDVLVGGRWPADLAWKIPLTYLVPFLVATWGALGSTRVRRRG